jgi:uridine phosphorylase
MNTNSWNLTLKIVANKVITVGTASRAEIIASFFDESPAPIRINSSRGFLTITGYYQGTRVSVVAIGMVNCCLTLLIVIFVRVLP